MLNYKIDRRAPTTSMLIIDPYFFPEGPDASYERDLVDVLDRFVGKIASLRLAAMRNRNAGLEARVDAAIPAKNSKIQIERKYTNVFHDRYWIADDTRGIFVGTSLNGIGKRYALIDFLNPKDASDIVELYRNLP